MRYVIWYALLAVPCFFVVYCNGADLNMRLPNVHYEKSFWKFYESFFSAGFYLLVHDYLGVYCPWSWARARAHRLADMRVFLGTNGHCHDRLGHITAADCDDPGKQEEIAVNTYISRARFWTGGAINFLIAPVVGLPVIAGIVADAFSRR